MDQADVSDTPQLLSISPNSRLTFSSKNNSPVQNFGTPTASLTTSLTQYNQPGAVIAKIEDIFESIADCILDSKKELTIKLKRKPKASQKAGGEKFGNADTEDQFILVNFPSKSQREARRFTALLNVLASSHEALVTGMTITKRDIYYRDPDLFVNQSLSDRCVDDIAYTLEVERDALNVVAAAKGLVAGSLKVRTRDDVEIDYATAAEGYLIPNMRQVSGMEPVDLKWVLVMEKEATFRTLAMSAYWKGSTAGRGLLITAKGYPDLQTRQFLNYFCFQNPKIPIFALVDFDPDGLGIMSTYKYGSMNLAHEHNTTVPSLEWLGVQSKDFLRINRYKDKQEKDPQSVLKLSQRDRRIAVRMLEKEEILGEKGTEQEWRREIQKMLMLNVKAEIQILRSGVKFEKWLDAKLRAGRSTYKRKFDGKAR